jgi:hypothetical protein
MGEMPVGSRTENTIVYIKGVPMGKPHEVSVTNQQIEFSAASAVASGKISVRIKLEAGEELTAQSAEEYRLPKVTGKDRPKVTTVSQQAKPNSLVTLTGRNLHKVNVVSIGGSKLSYTCQVTSSEDTSLKFKVPHDAGAGKYNITVRDKTDGSRIPTGKTLTVVE